MTNKILKRHIRAIKFNRFLLWLSIILAITCLCFAQWLQNACYSAWVNPEKTGTQEARINSIMRAIALQPSELTGYNNLLDIYMEDGMLTKAEYTQLRELLLERQGKMNNSKDDLTGLYRRIAFTYIGSYDNTVQQRLRAAYPYFEAATLHQHPNDLEQMIIDCYMDIAEYYSEYIWLTGAVRKPTAAQITNLIRQSKSILDSFPAEAAGDKLAFACVLADLVTQHGQEWAIAVGHDVIAEFTAKIEEPLQVAAQSPAARNLWAELEAWKNERHAAEEESQNGTEPAT